MWTLTGRLLFVGLLEVVQGLLEVPQVVIGHAGAVQGLEVLPLLPEHLETVLLHSLVVDQLHLQQAGCVEERGGEGQIRVRSRHHTQHGLGCGALDGLMVDV